MEAMKAVHAHLAVMMDQHKESKVPEQLMITVKDISAALAECDIPEERIAAFEEAFANSFGEDAMLQPENIIDNRQFVVSTPDAMVKVAPDQIMAIESRMIDGKKYILIPASSDVEVNGVSVTL